MTPKLLRVNNAAFAAHPETGAAGPLPTLAERRAEPWFDPDGLFLGLRRADEQPCWASTGRKVHPEKAGLGEVLHCSASIPRRRGSGLGGLLTAMGIAHLAQRLAGGRRTHGDALRRVGQHGGRCGTYRRLGFSQYSVDTAYARSGDTV